MSKYLVMYRLGLGKNLKSIYLTLQKGTTPTYPTLFFMLLLHSSQRMAKMGLNSGILGATRSGAKNPP